MKFLRIFFLVILTVGLFSCGNSSGNAPSSSLAPEVPPTPPPTALSISPAHNVLAVGNTRTLIASGGAGGYFFSIFSGVGSVLSTTGVYTAPVTPGLAVVRVTDSAGNYADATITVQAALAISPAHLSLSLNQTSTFSITGGVGEVQYSVVSGGGAIDASTGFFTAPGLASTIIIRATDSLGNTSDATVSVFAGLGLTPNPATVSVNSSTTFSVAGGAPPYNFSLVSGVGSINPSTGIYSAPATTGSAVVRVTDALGQTVDAPVTVQNLAPSISNIADDTINEDTPASINFTISDADSTLSCTSSVTATSSNTALLPVSSIVFSGTAPNCSAVLTPVAQASGASNVQFTVTDGVSTASSSFIHTVQAVNDAPVMSGIATQSTNEDTPVVVNFTINDVDSSLNCSSSTSASTSNASLVSVSSIVFSGTAPNCAATITPLANQNGAVNLTFRVTDAGGLYHDRTFTLNVLTVNDAPTIAAISAQSVKTDASLNVAAVINDIDSSLTCSGSVTVASSNTAVLPVSDISVTGTAPNCNIQIAPSLNVAGTSNLTVTVSDGSLSQSTSFATTVISVSAVTLSPSSLTLGILGTSNLAASVTYSNSTSQVVTTSSLIAWSSSNTVVATVNNTTSKGVVTGVSAGSANITATYKGLTSNTSALTVIGATSVTVSTGAVTGGIGSVRSIAATAQNSATSFDITNTASWSTSNSSVATVSQGVITFVGAGNAVITVTYGGLSATVNVVVQSKSLVSIAITGAASGVALNGTANLTATATYSDSSTEDVTNSAMWGSSNSSVISVSNTLPSIGRITGLAAGSSTITALVGGVSNSVLINVNSVTLTSIAVSPYDALVTSGATYSLRAIGTYSDSSTSDITDLVTWASSNTAAATISNTTGSRGYATTPAFSGYKTTNITATLNSVVGTTPFGVNGSVITSMLVTPTVSITPLQTYQLKAYANLADGGVIDLTEFAVWSSSAVSQVTVSNSVGSRGLVTGISNGTSHIGANFNSVSGTRTVTVADSSSVSEVGVGLKGTYYTWTGAPPPASPFVPAAQKGTRIDQQINFSWGSGLAPMGVGDQFAVRWTGFYKATSATNYFCMNSDDGIRVWINGVLIINNWTEHGPTWDCSVNQTLTVGTKYSIVVEFYENGGGAEAHLTRSSVSAADAQNFSTRAIPQSDLYLP